MNRTKECRDASFRKSNFGTVGGQQSAARPRLPLTPPGESAGEKEREML
jgi:hypothetical protein